LSDTLPTREGPIPGDGATEPATRDALKRNTILVVEDDPLVAVLIEDLLTEAGYQVIGLAASGSEALYLAEEATVGLALVDVGLVGPLDGIELACLLRGRFNIPTIFLSGAADVETRRRAAAAQPLDFLAKPFRPSQLYNAIEQALSGSGSQPS
jgi:two-component system, response regulator PdtaR